MLGTERFAPALTLQWGANVREILYVSVFPDDSALNSLRAAGCSVDHPFGGLERGFLLLLLY